MLSDKVWIPHIGIQGIKDLAWPFQPLIGGEAIPDMKGNDWYQYLGVNIGVSTKAALENVKTPTSKTVLPFCNIY